MNADNVVFFPKQINFPAVKIDDFLTRAEEDIIKILANTPEPTVPILEAGNETKNSLLKLSLIFIERMAPTKKLPYNKKNPSTFQNKKLVPLPTATVPSISSLITHSPKKTEQISLPSSNIPKKFPLFHPMGPFQNIDYLCKNRLY